MCFCPSEKVKEKIFVFNSLDCGKTIQSDGTGGLIKSPHYPQKYKSKTFCEWTIYASKRENKILIQLESFKIEGEMPPDKDDKGNYIQQLQYRQLA